VSTYSLPAPDCLGEIIEWRVLQGVWRKLPMIGKQGSKYIVDLKGRRIRVNVINLDMVLMRLRKQCLLLTVACSAAQT
jgi:hypothetical protein